MLDVVLMLYGWFELHRSVYTLSTLLSFSKKGIKSSNSESVISSNHEATGTCNIVTSDQYTTTLILIYAHTSDYDQISE